MKKIISVVGARPNFMKVAALNKALNKFRVTHLICHTGQHYDEKMSKVFFKDLELPKPDFYLGVGSGSHAEQTAKVMLEFEKVLLTEKPNLVIVVGDVNSTVACSLTAVKLGIKVAHVEAGLRSFDRSMPEEINRILTDSISDFLFVTEKSGLDNLKSEGVKEEKVFLVGNVMIDSLVHYLPLVETSPIIKNLQLTTQNYVLVTLHRPSNVDNEEKLTKLFELLFEVSKSKKILFPVHPRTRKNIESFGLGKYINNKIILAEPIGYIDFISLMKYACFILTDSGGIQEETTYLGVPCVTLRDTTERPITVEVGTNYLVGEDILQARKYIFEILEGNSKKGKIPDLWDGHAADRIVKILFNNLFRK